MTDATFGAELRRLRTGAGMSLASLARKTQFSRGYLSKIENGRQPPSADLARAMDDVFGAHGNLWNLAVAASPRKTDLVPVRPMQLPPAPADFVGRDNYLSQLHTAIAETTAQSQATIVIEGPPGVGKTSLLLRWAASVLDQFPDGCLYADLGGFSAQGPVDVSEVLDDFIRALGGAVDRPTTSIAARSRLLRSLLAGKHVLVALDNAASAQQVVPLLPGPGGAAVLTSRVQLSSVGLQTAVTHVPLSPMATKEAVSLLSHVAGEVRVQSETECARQIVHSCGRLPLAVRIAGEHIAARPHLTLRAMTEQLVPEGSRLDQLAAADSTINVRGVIDLSYRALHPRIARVFRLLGLHPEADFAAPVAAALADLSEDAAQQALEGLANNHLVELRPSNRVRLHNLLRLYAVERAHSEQSPRELAAARQRMLNWYLATASNANDVLGPDWNRLDGMLDVSEIQPPPLSFAAGDADGAANWCETEINNMAAVAREARQQGDTGQAWLVPVINLPYFYRAKQWTVWLNVAATGLAAAREGRHRLGTARCLQCLGWALYEVGKSDEAIPHFEESLQLHTELDDPHGHGWSAFGLGVPLSVLGRHHESREQLQRAIQLFTDTGFPYGVAAVQTMLASTYARLGEHDEAVSTLKTAINTAMELNAGPVEGLARYHLGKLLLDYQGQARQALPQLDRALGIRRATQERWGQAEVLMARGKALDLLGRVHEALDAYHEAARLFDDLRDPRALEVRAQIAMVTAKLTS